MLSVIIALWIFCCNSTLNRKVPLGLEPSFEVRDVVMVTNQDLEGVETDRPGIISAFTTNGSRFRIIFIDKHKPKQTVTSKHHLIKLPKITFHHIHNNEHTIDQTIQRMQKYMNFDSILFIPMSRIYQTTATQLDVYGYSDVHIDVLLSMAKFLRLLTQLETCDLFKEGITDSQNGTMIMDLNKINAPLFQKMFKQNIFDLMYTMLHFCDTQILSVVLRDIMSSNVEKAAKQQIIQLNAIHQLIKTQDPDSFHPYFGDLHQSTLHQYQAFFENVITSEFYFDVWTNVVVALIQRYPIKIGESVDGFLIEYLSNGSLVYDQDMIQNFVARIQMIRYLSKNLSEKNLDELVWQIECFKVEIERIYLRTFLHKLMFNPNIPRNIHVFVTSEELSLYIIHTLVEWGIKYPSHQLLDTVVS